MPGTRNGQPARPRAATALRQSAPGLPATGWSVDLRLVWDASCEYGWVTGSAWSQNGGELLELPDTELVGTDIQADVIALLQALWTNRAASRAGQR